MGVKGLDFTPSLQKTGVQKAVRSSSGAMLMHRWLKWSKRIPIIQRKHGSVWPVSGGGRAGGMWSVEDMSTEAWHLGTAKQ